MIAFDSTELSDAELLRYSRQLLLPAWDIAAQQRLRSARVLLIGAGGLGSPAALYLAAAGVGELWLCDHDSVDISNLQRQILHATPDIGERKVVVAQRRLQALNPQVQVRIFDRVADETLLDELVPQVQLVLDGSDNFLTRDQVNAACVRYRVPLVSAAAIRAEGQLTTFDFREPGGPCYRCLYPALDDADLGCNENGVLPALTGVMGSLQALEALKLLAGVGQPLSGRLLVFDALALEWRTLRFARDPACPVCSQPSM